jgi:hypothetical protein
MGHREEILSPLGYTITYREQQKYRGSGVRKLCTAVKDGVTYFAFRVSLPDRPEHYRRIERIQASIPHMARIAGTIEDVVLLEKAPGELLWELAFPPDLALSNVNWSSLRLRRKRTTSFTATSGRGTVSLMTGAEFK